MLYAQRVLPGTMESRTDHPHLEARKTPYELTSYRPINLLPIVSKVFEKLLLNRLLPLVENNRLIPKSSVLLQAEALHNRTDTSNCKKAKNAIPVTGRGGLQGCEMLRVPHCLDNRLTDGGKVVSPTHPTHFTPQKHYYFYVSGTHFC
jgi:hypothetical protein